MNFEAFHRRAIPHNVVLEKIQMNEYLILFGGIIIGSVVWTTIQIGAWTSILRKGASYRQMRGLLIGSIIGFPVFVGFIGLISTLLEPRHVIWSLLIAPGLIAYAIGLSLVGLNIAQRLVSPEPKNQADEESPNH